MAAGQAREAAGPERPVQRWRRRRFGRPPRRLKFTRAGRYYIAFTLVIGFAAINTGNNLLFLILGLMLAGIVLSGVLSESTLRGLSVRRALPADARAGKPSLVGLVVANDKPRLSSFAVVARDVTDRGEAGRVFALHLGPRESRELAYRWEPARRGKVAFLRVELATRYPFGLFEKWREVDLEGEMVVFPRDIPAPRTASRRAQPPGERPSGVAGSGTDFFALRDARADDDVRHIHWRTSARRGHPVVVEREQERRRRVALLVDNRAKGTAPTEEQLDDLVERAAALLRQVVVQGCEVALSASDGAVPAGAGPAHERRMLRLLALLGSSTAATAPPRVPGAETLELSLGAAALSEEA